MGSDSPARAYAPIGVFDSGLGGLTVLKAMAQALPKENFLYLGDTARVPYGIHSPETIARYTAEGLQYLVEKKVKAIVVACNSASTIIERLSPIDIPLLEVIRPGSQRALELSTTSRIGVLGTRATVQNQAYPLAIKALKPDAEVFQQACGLLVPLVEEGWIEDPLTNLVLHRYLQPLLQSGIDSLILGCTHYPLLNSSIQKVVGPNIQLIDSAEALALRLKNLIDKRELPANPTEAAGQIQLYSTDPDQRFPTLAENWLNPLKAQHSQWVQLVSLEAQ